MGHNQRMSLDLILPGACVLACLGAWAAPAPVAAAEGNVYYQCPGNVFTNTITAREAEIQGCKSRESQQPTTIAAPKPRSTGSAAPAPVARGSSDARVDPGEQKARDTDARRILEGELRKAEEALAQLRKDYNGGEPERRGDERNYQKYLDRVAELKASVTRTEADVAALKRELAKLN